MSSIISQFPEIPNILRLAKGRKYLFVDGAALKRTIANLRILIYGPDCLLSTDWDKVFEGYDRIYFYDALPVKNSNNNDKFEEKLKEIREFHSKLKRIPNVHVREGYTKFRKKHGLTQKGVDVYLATEALANAMRGNMDIAVFMLSDLDFFPLLEAFTSTRVQTFLLYDSHASSAEIIEYADVSLPISGDIINYWTLNPISNYRARRLTKLPSTIKPSDNPTNFESLTVDTSWADTKFYKNYTLVHDGLNHKYYIYNEDESVVVVSGSKHLALERLAYIEDVPMNKIIA